MLARLSLSARYAALLLVLTGTAGVGPAAAQRLSPLTARVLPAIRDSRRAPPEHALHPAPSRPDPLAPVAAPSRRRSRVTAPLLTRDLGPFEVVVLLERTGVTFSGCLCVRLRPF